MKQKLNLRFLMAFAIGMIMSVSAMAQTITVKGHVKDDLDVIIGAAVRQTGTTNGAVTDMDGNFTIKVPKGSNLTISYMGYISQTVKAAPVLNITLRENAKMLQETVVIGYGSVKKNDMTGSVATLKPDEKNHGIITSAQEMIQGKIAGVNVNMSSGEPGAGASITIRGGSSLNASTAPLIVIDGMAMDNDMKGVSNPLATINPNDIESFTVLKDASACAIYGSRGSNGVIIITTKKGKAGAPVKVSYNGSVSVATRQNSLNVMDASEYTSFITNKYGVGSTPYNMLGWKQREADGTPIASAGTYDTDWQDQIYRAAVSSDHNISLSGGIKAKNDKVFTMPYRVSVGFTEQSGILKGSSYRRFTGGVSLTPEFFDHHLTINANGKFVKSWTEYANTDAIGNAINMDPTQPVKAGADYMKYYTGNSELTAENIQNFGGYFQYPTTSGIKGDNGYMYVANGNYNPAEQVANGHSANHSTAWAFIGNADIAYKIHGFEDLSLHLNLSGEWTKGNNTTGDLYYVSKSGRTYYCQPRYTTACSYYGYGKYDVEDRLNTQLQAYLNYDHNWKDKHHLNVMAGYEWSKRKYSGDWEGYGYNTSVYNKNFFNNYEKGVTYVDYDPNKPDRQNDNLVLRDSTGSVWGSSSYIVSFYGRINYTLLNRYLFTFTARGDGSSRFAKGHQWGFFPSAAFAWRINDEPFMKKAKAISEMKLRLGWGKTGQQDIGRDYYYLTSYTTNIDPAYRYPVAVTPGTDLSKAGYMAKPSAYNDEIRWETTNTYNIGFDMGFLNQRIAFSADFYYRKTTDLFNLNSIPTGSNFDNQIYTNVGSLSNRGVEFSITARPIVTKNWYWEISANFAYNKNKIDELYGDVDKVNGWVSGGTDDYISYQKVGLPTNSFYVYQQVYDASGKPLQGVFVDRNGDGQINDNDKYWYKSINHPWNGGFSTRLQYKKWDIGTNFRFAIGGYVYNALEAGRMNTATLYTSNNGSNYLSNTTTDIATTGWNSYLYYASDYFVQNASYLKCDNITLGWSFDNWTRHKLSGRLAFAVSNVFIATKYKGLDPEQTSGSEGSPYPRPRTYTLSLNLNF